MTKPDRRQRWMADYESALVAKVPCLAGKVDWDTATFFYNQGLPATQAAERIAARFNEDDSA